MRYNKVFFTSVLHLFVSGSTKSSLFFEVLLEILLE